MSVVWQASAATYWLRSVRALPDSWYVVGIALDLLLRLGWAIYISPGQQVVLHIYIYIYDSGQYISGNQTQDSGPSLRTTQPNQPTTPRKQVVGLSSPSQGSLEVDNDPRPSLLT